MRHVLTVEDLSSDQIEQILKAAAELKEAYQRGIRNAELSGRVLGLLFSKPSLRTRVSFEAGMTHLGGSSLYLGQDVGWGTRESVADFARVISQYLDALVCRAHEHSAVEELARHSSCPVINGLTDLAHPCQALADIMTLREHFAGSGDLKISFVGDANNVSRSLVVACAKLGIEFALAAPEQYQFPNEFMEELSQQYPDAVVSQSAEIRTVVKDTSCVYTDVWSSMGFEDEAEKRRQDFANYQVSADVMRHAPPDAIFMHCLPAHRGQEVTDDVIDGTQSVVVQQAANRMHAQKGLLVWLFREST